MVADDKPRKEDDNGQQGKGDVSHNELEDEPTFLLSLGTLEHGTLLPAAETVTGSRLLWSVPLRLLNG